MRAMLFQCNFCRMDGVIWRTPTEEDGRAIGINNPGVMFYGDAIWRRIKRGVRSALKPQW